MRVGGGGCLFVGGGDCDHKAVEFIRQFHLAAQAAAFAPVLVEFQGVLLQITGRADALHPLPGDIDVAS